MARRTSLSQTAAKPIVALSSPGTAQTVAGIFGLIGVVGYAWAVVALMNSDVPAEFIDTEEWVYRIGFLAVYLLGTILVFIRAPRPRLP